MTDTEQRIVIAEWCGWKWWKHTKSETFIFCHPSRTKDSLDDNQMEWELCHNPNPQHFVSMSGVPDYLNDLNAMHEAEEVLLTGDGWKERLAKYSSKLMSVMHDTDFGRIDVAFKNDMVHLRYFTLHATARQRAEALLKTIGKWKE